MNQASEFNDIHILAARVKSLSSVTGMIAGGYMTSCAMEREQITIDLTESAAFFAELLGEKLHSLELKTRENGASHG